MSRLSEGLNTLVHQPLKGITNLATLGNRAKLESMYRKSGLRKFYEDNKSTILNTGALVGASMLAPGAMAALPGPGYAYLLGAAGTGALQDRARKEKQAAAELQASEQAKKDAANKNLDDTLKGITGGDPNSPVVGSPSNGNYISIQPVIDPSTGQVVYNPTDGNLADTVIGTTPLSGGAVGTGGTASKDQQDLLNEAELQYRLQQEQAGKSKADREQLLKDYSSLISEQQNRILDENAPALYEDLNRRGLLRSSELGNQMAIQREKAAQVLQEQVGGQALNDRDAYIKAMEDANTNYLGGRNSAIQRRYSLEDFARQAKVAKDTGLALQPISTGTPSSKAGDAAMVSAGANVATAMKGK